MNVIIYIHAFILDKFSLVMKKLGKGV